MGPLGRRNLPLLIAAAVSTSAPLILTRFQGAMTALQENLLMMSSLAELGLNRAMSGLLQRDETTCVRVIADDEEMDQLGSAIDKDGVELLVRYHPMASDLRRVIAGMKLSLALKRVGDQAVSIARRARDVTDGPVIPETQLVEEMHHHAAAMLKDGVTCFLFEDVDLALTLKARDRTLDEMNAFTCEKLIERMSQAPGDLRFYLALMFVSRHLERVGDYATNIGEDAVYAVAAEDIRHGPGRLRLGAAEAPSSGFSKM